MSSNPGIYSITHTASGSRYIGSATNITRRWYRHRSEANTGRHTNSRFQRAWKKHGAEAFVFEVLELCGVMELIAIEQRWIDSFPFETLYNARRIAHSGLGIKMTPENVEKLRARMKVSGCSPALRAAQLAWVTGSTQSEETKAKRNAALTGQKRSAETGARITEIMKNRDQSIIEKQRATASRTWHVVTPSGDQLVVVNLTRFANENDLQHSKLYAVAKGKRAHHKGYVVRAA